MALPGGLRGAQRQKVRTLARGGLYVPQATKQEQTGLVGCIQGGVLRVCNGSATAPDTPGSIFKLWSKYARDRSESDIGHQKLCSFCSLEPKVGSRLQTWTIIVKQDQMM